MHGRHCRPCATAVLLNTDRQPDENAEHGYAWQPPESKQARSEVGVGGAISMAGATQVEVAKVARHQFFTDSVEQHTLAA